MTNAELDWAALDAVLMIGARLEATKMAGEVLFKAWQERVD